ncbi:MAG: heme exporter protein CcmB [Thermoanaerobaculia bacterium]
MLRPASSWLAEAWAVLAKDWRAEFRSRYALSTLLLFALTMLVVVTLALGPVGATPAQKLTVPPVVLWLILLFAAASGVPRAFVHEEESRTAIALRLAATPSAVFVGKFAFVASLVAALEIVVTPLLLAVLQADVDRPATLVAVLAAGGFGLAAASTLVAALVAQARGKGALFAVLAFPILVPLVLLAVEGTRAALGGPPAPEATGQLLLYDGSVTVASLMLFPAVWNP